MAQSAQSNDSAERAEQTALRSYLESRVREEADAAARASTLGATLVHLDLATAYARRVMICPAAALPFAGRSAADEIRVW